MKLGGSSSNAATTLVALNRIWATGLSVRELMKLVAACGLNDSPSPYTTAMAISADLEKLAGTSSQWTHPAQVVKNPDALALYRLCAARVEVEVGAARKRLEEILPRLKRTARLTEKAASRRSQSTPRQPKWVDRWL